MWGEGLLIRRGNSIDPTAECSERWLGVQLMRAVCWAMIRVIDEVDTEGNEWLKRFSKSKGDKRYIDYSS